MDTIDRFLVCFLIVMLSLLTGFICYECAERNVREQAVLKGYAEWKVNARGTDVTFEWK